jgi:predicted nucleic-acid-binding Zn-ribbon protein
MGIIKSFRDGLAGKTGGETFVVAGKTVSCRHCAHAEFIEGRAQLNTAGMTFFKLDWANASAATLTCTNCGLIEWFLGDPQTTEEALRQ